MLGPPPPGFPGIRDIPNHLRAFYIAQGWWSSKPLGRLIADGLAEAGGQPFRVHSAVRPYTATMRDVENIARCLAAGLQQRGVVAGDVVAFQLPNWMEAAAVFWASTFLGAVVVPIVHFYASKELGYILASTTPKVFITAADFGRMSYEPALSAQVPIVGVVGVNFDELIADQPLRQVADTDAAAPALIAFTSGTTRNPKGVIHSHQSLGFETRQLLDNQPPNTGAQLTALPVGHFIGMLGAFLLPVLGGGSVDLLDVWDAGHVLDLMESHGLAVGGGPPYFVTSVIDHERFRPEHLPYISHIGLGGSTVPTVIAQRLTDLGVTVTRSYGSTEHPSITGSPGNAPQDKRLYTDGCARRGVEIRLAGDGEIISRGPDLCLGYTDPALTAAAFDEDGWYHTGDIGRLDEDGFLTITDRKSDIIIRGGENISALEVEEILLTLAAVAEAVVVAAPDRRLGEHPAAVVRLRPGAVMPTLDDVRTHFRAAGLARQKWPEELIAVDDFPRTASGKIQKYRVRQQMTAQNHSTTTK
ncbi:AMP-binding protein [Mycobacterium sp. OTB74]|uniref:AMP-binding protein n=1 Tax=Mycobacterium sp. OTB74 TaxID=1853452 RepID=UPI0024771464|nr:AMP-binding protein [Mycobacterium sp. OTB74]